MLVLAIIVEFVVVIDANLSIGSMGSFESSTGKCFARATAENLFEVCL